MSSAKIKLSPQVKRIIFIILVLLAGVFLFLQFQKGSEFRTAKRAFNDGKYDEAAVLFSKLGTYSESDQFVNYCYAMKDFEAGEFQSAQTKFEALNRFQKSDKYAYYCKGMLLSSSGNYWEAAQYFDKCQEGFLGTTAFLDSKLQSNRCYYTCGTLLFYAGDYANAAICFRHTPHYEDTDQLLAECEAAIK